MVRTLTAQFGTTSAVLLLLLATPATSSAQQNLAVDCSTGGNVNTVLGQFTNRNANNRLTISGSCTQFVTVRGFNGLTLEGTAGATLKRGMLFQNSTQILLKNLTIDPDFSGNLVLNSSHVILEGTTIQDACCEAQVQLFANSTLGGSFVAPSVITNGPPPFTDGVQVGPGSAFFVRNMTISNNGRRGIFAENGGTVILISREFQNGQLFDLPVDISGNGAEGIEIEAGTLELQAEGATSFVHIHDNGGTGISVFGTARLEGTLKVENNGEGDLGPAQVEIGAGTAVFGMGTQVVGPIVAFGSTMLFGSGGPMTHTGGVQLNVGSVAGLTEQATIDQIDCDASSWVTQSFGGGTITTNNCPLEAPVGTPGPQGIQGPQGEQGLQGVQGVQGPQGAPGISERTTTSNIINQVLGAGGVVVRSVPCPAGKTVLSGGGMSSNPNLLIMGSLPTNATTWAVTFKNTANTSQGATLTVSAVCAIVQ
jgi:hypothetical protein